jgi:hypothetical protein
VGGNIGTAGLDETEAEQETRIDRGRDQDGETGAYVRAWVWVPISALTSPSVKQDELDLLFNPRPREPRDILGPDDSVPIFTLGPKRRIVLQDSLTVLRTPFAMGIYRGAQCLQIH